MKTKALIAVLFFSTALSGIAQEIKNWKDGELLIRLSDNTNIQNLEQEFNAIDLTGVRLLSEHMNIWHFTYDHTSMTIDEAIQTVGQSNVVHTVQRNHILKNRAVPNDSQYDDQWQYSQPSDRDIDADEAWDIATGGLTSTGDTIVVCVIDDGVNFSHPDLIPNLWRNYGEIPGNGVDDDGNGYVDDVRGWNAYIDNDNVAHNTDFFEGHGSAVAGIVGAKGDNNIGVTGVNWDVKLMIVKGGGAESQAIAAYSYALENRKLYNATNGEKGAFVVATNASWGVDFGMAVTAPLWCAMYDTLGNHGVLNAGATINGNVNVDIYGDLPTQCPSDYLISVTNTRITDVKETEAGWGDESIDLGAPGSGTWTVAQFSNGYSSFGGTSGATPHVAGTIALLYSAPCPAFADLAKSNPKLAAEKVRDYILNGVDDNASLDGITVTGGRLNTNNSIRALVDECSAAASVAEFDHTGFSANLFPNPLQGDELNVSIEAVQTANGQIQIFDMAGKNIYNQSLKLFTGTNQFTLQLPEMVPGVYNVFITTADGNKNLKLLK